MSLCRPLLRLIAALACLPSLALAVILDPGNVGDFFFYTEAGTVEALDGNDFRIEFAEQKYITITPYETDARFVFGIDFNSSGLDATPVAGYLTDSQGNAIPGTDFTGNANSSGIGGGILTLNEVVVAYGAYITFTGEPPVAPFPVRFGSGVFSNVVEDRAVIGQGDAPNPDDISIDAVSACAGPDHFEFEVTATGTDGEMVFQLAADSDPDPQLGPTERVATQINALTGDINSEAEPIAESFGTPPFDRWQDGLLDDFSIDAAGGPGSWTFSGRVPNGAEPFAPGDSLWGVVLREGDTEISSEAVVIGDCDPGVVRITVPARLAPTLDGRIDYREWTVAPQLELAGGTVTFMHEANRLYLLINMLEDGTDNALRDGGPDQFSLLVDVDEDGAITPDLDRRYRMLEGTGNFRFETWADPAGSSFNPPEEISFSALGEGFGCFVWDGSATITPLSCAQHRVWEVALDLLEIQASGDKSVRIGLRVQTDPDVVETLPIDLTALDQFIHLELEGRTNQDEPSRGPPDAALTLAELRITQAIQRENGNSPLVASRQAYADLLVDTEEGEAESVVASLFMSRDGVDLPGSPLDLRITYNTGWGSSVVRSGPQRRTIALPGELLSGDMSFRLAARQPILDATVFSDLRQQSFLETRTPVYWIVPVNTADAASPNLPGQEFLQRSEMEVRAVFPLAEVDFVRRPPLLADPETADDAIALMNQYDQQAVLAWTLGLLFTGESPFTLPDQIVGAFPADQELDSFLGMSDPRWWFSGAGRVVWVKEVTYDAGLLLPHELNHNLDTNIQGSWGRHVVGCGSIGLDPQWPYPNLQIQQPGMVARDVIGRNGFVLNPPLRVDPETPDYMSYCRATFGNRDTAREAYPAQWVSPYRWQRQLNGVFERAAPAALRTLDADPAAAEAVGEMLYINGRVDRDGGGALDPILMQPGIPRAEQVPGAYTVQLLSCDQELLLEKSFAAGFESVEGQPRDSSTFSMVLPDPGGVCALQLVFGDEVLAEREQTPNAPEVQLHAPDGGEFWDGIETVSWTATDADGDPTSATLLYSPDAGQTWLPVATGISGSEYPIDSTGLPGSENALLRVLVSDGMHTVQDDSDAVFEVAEKAPVVSIITPTAATGLRVDEAFALLGSARNTAGSALPADSFVWSIDGEPTATGNPVSLSLDQGEQVLGLEVAGANGLTGSTSLVLNVAGTDRDGDGIDDDVDSCPDSVPGAVVVLDECETQVENRLLDNGCSLEEIVNTSLGEDGRDGLIALMQSMRKAGELDKQDQKQLKQCVRE